uniref:TERF1 (TRF1)-interacting nuclear factor 2 n=1 Tax=Sphaeramia orbicularis TaxID=375764 RepID=A0A672YX50_9TELE
SKSAVTNKTEYTALPFVALQLLAPPVRLVSAALWKVMKQRDVMQYGVVEEFVTSACETVPGLLTMRHQGKLALGLRARLILELCSTEPDAKLIEMHLKRICAPTKKDLKILKTVECFHSHVKILLSDPIERERYFKEEFPVEYGQKFDQELEKLLWEFLIRLDQFFPVPNLAQTVSWLSEVPLVLEECARAATQPQLLKILLEHQTCLGHLETAGFLFFFPLYLLNIFNEHDRHQFVAVNAQSRVTYLTVNTHPFPPTQPTGQRKKKNKTKQKKPKTNNDKGTQIIKVKKISIVHRNKRRKEKTTHSFSFPLFHSFPLFLHDA